MQIRLFKSSKNKLKQKLSDSCIVLASISMYIWSSSSMFTMSHYVIFLYYINSFMEGICRANQWTGFSMITASVVKELNRSYVADEYLYLFITQIHINPLSFSVALIYKPVNWCANQWTGFYMRATLALNGLSRKLGAGFIDTYVVSSLVDLFNLRQLHISYTVIQDI